MKWSNGCRIRLMLFGIVVVFVLGGGRAKADFVFGEPTNLGPTVNSSAVDIGPYLSPDGLTLHFTSPRPSGYGIVGMWVTKRESNGHPWEEPVPLGPPFNTDHKDADYEISADGLELFFGSDRPGGHGAVDIWVAMRESQDADWGDPVNLGSLVNSPADEAAPSISANGLELYFSGWRPEFARPGSNWSDIWVTTRPTKYDPWGEPVNLGPVVNSSTQDARPCISSDGLALFFDSQRHGRLGDGDLYMTRRATVAEPWGTPVSLGPVVNSLAFDECPYISTDGSTLFFDSLRPGGSGDLDLWQAPIIPIVDFNGDRIVDAEDMCIMVDHWGTDYSFCDIGPMPWGDGVVDVQDLIILAEHLFEGVPVVQ